MDTWTAARERYIEGGVTQSELAQLYGLPLGTLRRRAADEKWTALREGHSRSETARLSRIDRQLRLTDRMMDIIEQALTDDGELHGYVEFWKNTSGGEFMHDRLPYLNDERFARLVKAAIDVFELQRTVLDIHSYKDELSAQKLERDASIAERKLELELLKLETSQETDASCGDFLAALGISDGGGGDDEG